MLLASPNYFDVLGVRPQIGRLFGKEDEGHGITEVAVLSDAIWRRRFGGLPDAIGRKLRIDDDWYTVVGVLPPGFRHPGRSVLTDVDVWAPTGFVGSPFPQTPVRGAYFITGAIGRLKPGIAGAGAGAPRRIRAAACADLPGRIPRTRVGDAARDSAADRSRWGRASGAARARRRRRAGPDDRVRQHRQLAARAGVVARAGAGGATRTWLVTRPPREPAPRRERRRRGHRRRGGNGGDDSAARAAARAGPERPACRGCRKCVSTRRRWPSPPPRRSSARSSSARCRRCTSRAPTRTARSRTARAARLRRAAGCARRSSSPKWRWRWSCSSAPRCWSAVARPAAGGLWIHLARCPHRAALAAAAERPAAGKDPRRDTGHATRVATYEEMLRRRARVRMDLRSPI